MSQIDVVKNEEPYTLSEIPQVIFTFGAKHIATSKTVTHNNKVYIWINSRPHPMLHGGIPNRAIDVISSVWIIISGVEPGALANHGSIVLRSSQPEGQGRTWSAECQIDTKVTVTILEATLAVDFKLFLPFGTNIQELLSNDDMDLPVSLEIDQFIKEILDHDWEERQKAAGVIDFTGLHSQFESLHTRLVSLENKLYFTSYTQR